jgi:hypothetical protein
VRVEHALLLPTLAEFADRRFTSMMSAATSPVVRHQRPLPEHIQAWFTRGEKLTMAILSGTTATIPTCSVEEKSSKAISSTGIESEAVVQLDA